MGLVVYIHEPHDVVQLGLRTPRKETTSTVQVGVLARRACFGFRSFDQRGAGDHNGSDGDGIHACGLPQLQPGQENISKCPAFPNSRCSQLFLLGAKEGAGNGGSSKVSHGLLWPLDPQRTPCSERVRERTIPDLIVPGLKVRRLESFGMDRPS